MSLDFDAGPVAELRQALSGPFETARAMPKSG